MDNFKNDMTFEKAEILRKVNGSNKLTQKKKDGFWKKFFQAFNDPIIKILLVALVLNLVFVFIGHSEWYEALGIFIAVLIATFVATFSEYSNEKTFEKLQAEADQIKCKVMRDNIFQEISIDDIVVGDIVKLEAGDKIPADGEILHGTVKVNQASLNGEAEDVTKTYGESFKEETFDKSSLFRGTIITEGECILRIVNVGDETILGKLAQEVQEDNNRDTPLKIKLTKLAEYISSFGYIGAVAIAVAYMSVQIFSTGVTEYFMTWQQPTSDLLDALILAVIIVVMAVPEGLPLMIALVSGLNMKKMLKDNVLVKQINGIETAGSLNILFSDKTGTITKGELEVVEFINGDLVKYSSIDKIKEKSETMRNLVNLSVIYNSSSSFSIKEDKISVIGGNATEKALFKFLGKNAGTNTEVNIINKLPFNSTNKYSASQIKVNEHPSVLHFTLIKGAPEKLLSHCTHYYNNDGERCKFSNMGELALYLNEQSKKSMRMLALVVSEDDIVDNNVEINNNLTLIGMVSIRDDVRPEAITAIKEVQSAGVQVVMITGDVKETAVAIAKDSGIMKSNKDIVLTSSELQELSDDEVKEILPNIKVISRALPSDKSRLVKLSQDLNLVAAMTGDGVNDSPALKKSDVGFAMGSGTEVAKEAGDIVILDDNFKSISKAILYGRTIYNNIRLFIIFQLTINISAVFISFIAPLLNLPTPLTIIQILWINLIMDSLAAIAFGGIAPLKEYMKEKPKKRDENIVSKRMLNTIFSSGLFITVVSMLFLGTNLFEQFFRIHPNDNYLLTGFFTTYVLLAVVNGFCIRTDKINIFSGLSKNKNFALVFLSIVAVQVAITYLGNDIVRTYGLNGSEWIVVGVATLSIVVVNTIRKIFQKK